MNLRSALVLTLLALPPSAALAGGTISGKVEANPPKYLAETVVYVKEAPGTFAKKSHEMDQKGMKFLPHLLAITVGDSVKFLNHDHVGHNVYTTDNEGYNLGTFKEGEERSYTFNQAGVYSQLCSVHPEMLGYIWVGQNPYSAVVDAHGNYKIADVPAGAYEVEVWNSNLKASSVKVTVAEGKTATAHFSLKR